MFLVNVAYCLLLLLLPPSLTQQRCLEELDVLDQMSRLSLDPFQHNRRLSETNLLDFKGQCTTDHRAESHSVAQSPPPHLAAAIALPKDYNPPDNPFQNDALPLWVKKKAVAAEGQRPKVNSCSNSSSPDYHNYGGQQQAYRYRNLNETPRSPELANHRMLQGRSSSPPPLSPEIIQVKTIKSLCFLSSSLCSLQHH